MSPFLSLILIYKHTSHESLFILISQRIRPSAPLRVQYLCKGIRSRLVNAIAQTPLLLLPIKVNRSRRLTLASLNLVRWAWLVCGKGSLLIAVAPQIKEKGGIRLSSLWLEYSRLCCKKRVAMTDVSVKVIYHELTAYL